VNPQAPGASQAVEVLRFGSGDVFEIWRLPDDLVTFHPDLQGGAIGLCIAHDGTTVFCALLDSDQVGFARLFHRLDTEVRGQPRNKRDN
jgi:hypothetical protein